MMMHKDKTQPRHFMLMTVIGTTIGTILLAAVLIFTDIGSHQPTWMKFLIVAVSYIGMIIWAYSKRPIRDRRKPR